MAARTKNSQNSDEEHDPQAGKLTRRLVYLSDQEYEALRKQSFETRQSMTYIMRCGIRKELGLPPIDEPIRGRPKAENGK